MKRDPEGSFMFASDARVMSSRADALTDRIKAMFAPNPPGEFGPSDEPESQYRFGYNTALENVLSAIAASPVEQHAAAPTGYCERAGSCVCGGDLPRVREGCSEWVKVESQAARATSANETGAEGATDAKKDRWCPDECPVTGKPFFMWIAHPELGYVPTYGGPFDSYTIASPDDDGYFRAERYDHDEGSWVEGGAPVRVRRELVAVVDLDAAPATAALAPADERADLELLPINRQWMTTKGVALVAEYRNCKASETEEVMRRFVSYMKAALEDAAARAAASPAAMPDESSDEFKAACSMAYKASKAGVGPCGAFIAGYRALRGIPVDVGVPQPAQADAPADALTIADYEGVLADHRRLVRELDVLLNGEEGAAQQASLSDIVAQVRREKAQQEPIGAVAEEAVTAGGNPWEALFDRVALELNCLPSSFVNGNDHVFAAIAKLRSGTRVASLTDEQRKAIRLAITLIGPKHPVVVHLRALLDGADHDR
ncbi:hypothetical protein WL66_05480 [Burkholderia ubonensis]|nr:hypothetical protein WL66_05480 [Burkholderia ubonensis]